MSDRSPAVSTNGDPQVSLKTALFVFTLGSFTTPMMLSSVTVAIPAIGEALAADAFLLSWLPTSFLITNAIFLLPVGKLADQVGRKKIYLTGLLVSMCASILASLANSVELLIFYRLIQGIGAAMTFSTGMAILVSIFPLKERGKAMGIVVSGVYVGLGIGPFLGGIFTDWLGWRSVFLFHVPLTLVTLSMIVTQLPGEWKSDAPRPFDIGGTIRFALAVATLMVGVALIPDFRGLLLMIVSGIAFYLFVRYENRQKYPLFKVRIFSENRVFTYSCLSSTILSSGIFSIAFLFSVYLQVIRGLSATSTGKALMVQTLLMALMSPISGRLSDRYEPRIISSIGALSVALGFFALSLVNEATPLILALGPLVLTGFGYGLFSTPNNNAIMTSVPVSDAGTGSAAANTSRVLGNMAGMGIVSFIIAIMVHGQQFTEVEAGTVMLLLKICFTISAVLTMLSFYFSWSRGNLRAGSPAT